MKYEILIEKNKPIFKGYIRPSYANSPFPSVIHYHSNIQMDMSYLMRVQDKGELQRKTKIELCAGGNVKFRI